MPASPQQSAQDRANQNAAARSIVLQNSVKMVQQIGSLSVNPANQNVINFQPRNVGLTLGFLVVVSATVANAAGSAAALSPFGPANMVQQLTYTDLQNLNRVQTTGAHLALLNSAKQGFVFGGAYPSGTPLAYGNNFDVMDGAASLAASATGKVKTMLWVPLAYGATDLRGACYTNVVNATQNLQIVLNQNPFNADGSDKYNSVYNGNAGGYSGNVVVTIFQVYRDQIPFNNGMPILPIDDLNIVYDLKNTNLSGITANADFTYAYPNMRQFLSTFALFRNGATIGYGADVNYWSITSANSTELLKATPDVIALFARQTFMGDPPAGAYYFDHRDKPIDTITFGNMALNLNASTVNAGASVSILTEAFQQTNQIPYAASLSLGA
jgi:hypothetical protein